jgi:ATP-binding cassette subfamily B protein
MGDRAAIVEAARRAGAHSPIEALPDGYDTVLSRQFGGVDLSTGQWQRVALARAFLRDAPLVVLDEPTAALDPRAERDLFETVASLYRSRSAVLISHRLSSVRFWRAAASPSRGPTTSCWPSAAPTPSCSTSRPAPTADR